MACCPEPDHQHNHHDLGDDGEGSYSDPRVVTIFRIDASFENDFASSL